MSSVIKAAVIGIGNISGNHLSAIADMPDVALTAVCDDQPVRADAASEKYGVRAFYSVDDLLKDGDFDVLHICLPHYLHAPYAVKALNAGKHVLCEKPMALNVREANEMRAAAAKNGKKLGICFQNRYNPASVSCREIIDSGRLGAVKSVRAAVFWERGADYYLADSWRGKKATEGGGVLINQAIHTLDLVRWFASSEVTEVSASISTKKLSDVVETEDTADLYLKFASGATAAMYATLNAGANYPVEIDVALERGTVSIGDKFVIREHGAPDRVFDVDRPGGSKSYWGSGHAALIRDFYDSVIEDRPFAVDGDEAVKTSAILDKVYGN